MQSRILTAILIVLSTGSCVAQQLPDAPSYSSSVPPSQTRYMLDTTAPHKVDHHTARKTILFAIGGAVVVGTIVAFSHSGSQPASRLLPVSSHPLPPVVPPVYR